MFKQVTVLGIGLLGGSVLQAIKRQKLASRVVAWSPNILTRKACQELPECDDVKATAREAVKKSDFIILCPPVDAILPLLRDIAPYVGSSTIVTDVGSTKYEICIEAHKALHTNGFFVGSHPMAGSEKRGIDHADPNIFRKRACFVTPLANTDEISLRTTKEFWEGLEMKVTVVDPKKHDTIVADISHLPHMLASTLAAYLGSRDPEWIKFAGGGLKDTTRVASGDPSLWLPIIAHNRDCILNSLRLFEKELTAFRRSLELNDEHDLLKLLKDGKVFRDKL